MKFSTFALAALAFAATVQARPLHLAGSGGVPDDNASDTAHEATIKIFQKASKTQADASTCTTVGQDVSDSSANVDKASCQGIQSARNSGGAGNANALLADNKLLAEDEELWDNTYYILIQANSAAELAAAIEDVESGENWENYDTLSTMDGAEEESTSSSSDNGMSDTELGLAVGLAVAGTVVVGLSCVVCSQSRAKAQLVPSQDGNEMA